MNTSPQNRCICCYLDKCRFCHNNRSFLNFRLSLQVKKDNSNVYNGHHQTCNFLNLRHEYVQQHKRYSFLHLVYSMSTSAGFDVLASNLPDYLNKFNRSFFVPLSLFLGRSFLFFIRPFEWHPFQRRSAKVTHIPQVVSCKCMSYLRFISQSVSSLECTFVIV